MVTKNDENLTQKEKRYLHLKKKKRWKQFECKGVCDFSTYEWIFLREHKNGFSTPLSAQINAETILTWAPTICFFLFLFMLLQTMEAFHF